MAQFNFTEAQEMLRREVRDFAQKELAPGARERAKSPVMPRDIIKKIDKEVISDEKIPEHIKTKAVNGLVKIAKKNSYLIGCVKNIVYKHPCSTEEVISFIFETNSPNKVFKNLLKRTKKIKDKKDGRKILDMITARAFLIKKYEATMPLEIIGKIMSYL